eukprot:jgi/Psemu1/7323/gm1.7323_g
MIKFLCLLSVFFLLSVHQQNVEAFSPVTRKATENCVLRVAGDNHYRSDADEITLSRRNMMQKGIASAVLSLSTASVLVAAPNSAVADIYDEQEKARKLKKKEEAENAKKLVPTILIGGTALSVPFFLPNLLRLGKKFLSFGEEDGYGGPK